MEEKDKEIVKQEECIELKNIKYKTMLLNGNPIVETKSSNNLSNLDKFLEDEKNNSKNEPWSKLNKTIRTQKVLSFVESYKNEKKLNEEEEKLLLTFLKECLDKKRLTRVKDVIYDKVTGNIKEIPALFYNKSSKHFTLKNLDKRVSTLKSLPANKHKKSLTNTSESHDNDNDSEDKLFV
jgi:hypothetical protein